MEEVYFLNGEFIEKTEAVVPIEDRGFLFGDGVYEVIRCYEGQPFCLEEHLRRLERSAAEIKLELPPTREEIGEAVNQMAQRVGGELVDVYLQVTRGAARRTHQFPGQVEPTIAGYARLAKAIPIKMRREGVKAIVVPDLRWLRCDIKSVNLLPNVLARQEAEEQGAFEALFERDGVGVIEGSASNLFIVQDGRLKTAPDSNLILSGITRQVVLQAAHSAGIPVEMEFFSRQELLGADEAFVTSTTKEVLAVTRIDEQVIGSGRPGPMTRLLADHYRQEVEKRCRR